jgi:hypothetical protein
MVIGGGKDLKKTQEGASWDWNALVLDLGADCSVAFGFRKITDLFPFLYAYYTSIKGFKLKKLLYLNGLTLE